jgi:triacylglycerol lipase
MKKLTKTLLIATLVVTLLTPAFTSIAKAETNGNDYPVVLCHGNGGWGRDEKSGYLYWGGDVDIEEALNDSGYEVYTAVVGPYSSNWDRACELYAYIKGGTVDYGKAHSEKYGHERYGRTFPGLYPEWGQEDGSDLERIHLLGHSQGGQTVRMLVQLLEEGMESEINAVLGENASEEQIEEAVASGDLSKLFSGTCNDWVESVTTFATPNDGTTAADIVSASGDLLGLFATPINGIFIDSVTGLAFDEDYNFDLKLDQWGLTRKPGECFSTYFIRVMGSSMWEGTKDFSHYDLSTSGTREMNKWVKDQPNVYYFSYSCKATKKTLLTGFQIPDSSYMNPLFFLNTIAMGSYTNYSEGIDSTWYPNDGYVNTISQDGPTLGRSDENIVPYNGSPERGVWNHMGILSKTDHEDIIGRDTSDEMGDLITFYINYIQMLQDL